MSALDDLVPLLDPTAPPRVLSAEQARSLGWAPHHVRYRVDRRQWQRLAPGVVLTAPPATARDLRRAAVLYGGPGALLSGAAALDEYGILRRRPGRELVLLPPHVTRRSVGRIVTLRLGSPLQPSERHGLPLAPVARAVDDHVRTLAELDDVRAVVAAAVQTGRCSIGELQAQLARTRRNGSAAFRQAVAEVVAGARSGQEARAATLLRRGGIGGFEQNYRIQLPDHAYVADFAWPRLRAILEIDSVEYHFSRADWQRTLARHLRLEASGWSVVHVPPSALADAAGFVADIARWLDGRRTVISST